MNHTELIMRRRTILAFIKADPIALVITRQAPPEKNLETGGYTKGLEDTLTSQLARIVQNKRRYNNGIINSEAGDLPHTDYLLMGQYTLDVEEEDTFVWNGENYHVTAINKLRTESTLCSIDLLGATKRA